MKRTWKALALAGACGLAVCAQARADVIYTFTTTGTANSTDPSAPPADLTVSLDLLNSTVQSGSADIATTPIIPNPGQLLSYVSGADEFNSVSFLAANSGGGTATPTNAPIRVDISLTFAANGDVTSSDATFGSDTEVAYLAGTGATASGGVGTDNGRYVCGGNIVPSGGGTSNCTVSGDWTHTVFTPSAPVPEPATFALLGAGVLGLAAARRRGTASPA